MAKKFFLVLEGSLAHDYVNETATVAERNKSI
jgi:hypothetical protein